MLIHILHDVEWYRMVTVLSTYSAEEVRNSFHCTVLVFAWKT